MNPYSLDWPSRISSSTTALPFGNLNLFEGVTTNVHTEGRKVVTSWYDDNHWGFFPDAYPQQWTHQREVWLLYDQWAVAKGIVTSTIDVDVAER
mmetsp:Transcript_30366/g.44091  ORF Transcript_30366/g.44091 Transcript_30366/m.44091 type:complete len:94 (+) Transcript_30366:1-282(+)